MGFDLQQTIEKLAGRFGNDPSDAGTARRVLAAVDLAGAISLPLDLSPTQNIFYDVTRSVPLRFEPDSEAGRVIELLGASLRIRPRRPGAGAPG